MVDAPDIANIRNRLAEALGSNAYNRLIESVRDVDKRHRLRFWQEQLIQQAASATGIIISTTEEFLRIFDGARPIAVATKPLTRDEFLKRIEESPHGSLQLDETPPEWMATAWEIKRVREELCREMARTVSKLGGLFYTDDYLHYLSRSLPIARQVELFLYIRDRNPHREDEFRSGFERAFPESVPHLPRPQQRRHV
jgi:hypothetical protein